jgi:cleavage and polyadenylation specificity factor subunit 1
MMLFGKSKTRLEVMTAEFLPWEKQLYFTVFDVDSNMLILQFDPERKFCFNMIFPII